jgi:predicted membrane protein
MDHPTQSIPAGCFIGSLALFPFVFAIIGMVGLYRWSMLAVVDRHFDNRFWFLTGATLGGLLLAVGLIYLSYRMIKSANLRGYDSRDPDQPNVKW